MVCDWKRYEDDDETLFSQDSSFNIVFCVLITFQQTNVPFFSPHQVTGTPPRFIQEPEDMLVFTTNADMSRASLTLYCTASGDPSPNITWYRNGMTFTNTRTTVSANGTLLIVNITEATDATQGGLPYHCTATNKFGTIRSRTANISYACELRGESYCSHWTMLRMLCLCVCCIICFRF